MLGKQICCKKSCDQILSDIMENLKSEDASPDALSQATLDALYKDVYSDGVDNLDNLDVHVDNGTGEIPAYQIENFLSELPPCAHSLSIPMANPRTSFTLATNYLATQQTHNLDNMSVRPSSLPWPGRHEFEVTFEVSKAKPTKACSWTYSSVLGKLFCRDNVPVPFRFKFKESIPNTAYIRAFVLPKKDDTFIVKRCPLHKIDELISGRHFLVLGEKKGAQYGQCENTGLLTVRFPAVQYQAGMDYQAEIFIFPCFSSCLGINKRDIQILFTLEDGGAVLGRGGVELKVCACPGRDRKEAETRQKKNRILSERKSSSSEDNAVAQSLRKIPVDPKTEGENVYYNIAVRGKERYEKIKKVCDLIDSGKQYDIIGGEMVPLERTQSGGVCNWLIKHEGTRLESEQKVYLEESDGPSKSKKRKEK